MVKILFTFFNGSTFEGNFHADKLHFVKFPAMLVMMGIESAEILEYRHA